eukprot:6462349-Amphidinium_carterae.1
MGGRGLPALTAEQAARTNEWLDAAESALPAEDLHMPQLVVDLSCGKEDECDVAKRPRTEAEVNLNSYASKVVNGGVDGEDVAATEARAPIHEALYNFASASLPSQTAGAERRTPTSWIQLLWDVFADLLPAQHKPLVVETACSGMGSVTHVMKEPTLQQSIFCMFSGTKTSRIAHAMPNYTYMLDSAGAEDSALRSVHL